MTSKKCTKCKIIKELSEFYADKSSSDGRHSQCKSCSSIQDREIRENLTEEKIQRRRESREKYANSLKGIAQIKISLENYRNSLKGKMVHQQYISDHKNELKEKRRKYYLEHKKEINKKGREYYKEHANEIQEKQKQYSKTENGRDSLLRSRKKYMQAEKQTELGKLKHEASIAIHQAVRHGMLPHISVQFCEQCGKQAEDYHHHKGYEKEYQLDVIPLCTKCHNSLTHFSKDEI